MEMEYFYGHIYQCGYVRVTDFQHGPINYLFSPEPCRNQLNLIHPTPPQPHLTSPNLS